MSTRFSVGVTRNVDQANFGSVGATCHFDVEMDEEFPRSVSRGIREGFRICREEVDHELSQQLGAQSKVPTSVVGHTDNRNGSKGAVNDSTRPRPATKAQIRAIHAIASKARVRLASQLEDEYGVRSLQALTIRQASQLIDELKSKAQPADV